MMEYKTVTCKVCGEEFRPHRDHRYTVQRDPGLGFFIATPLFSDAIDCPHCGCQIVLGSRLGVAFGNDEEGDDELVEEDQE